MVLGGPGTPVGWLFAAALVPPALRALRGLSPFSRGLSPRRAARRAGNAEAIPCDIVPDPLAPDWAAVSRGVADAAGRVLVSGRPARLRLFPCPGLPYEIAVSAKGVVARPSPQAGSGGGGSAGNGGPPAVSRPDAGAATRPVPTVPLAVRAPLPFAVAGEERVLWIEPPPPDGATGGRVVLRAPSAPSRAFRRLPWLLSHLSLLFLLRHAFDGRVLPSLFDDPVRLVLYGFALPLAAAAGVRRMRAPRPAVPGKGDRP